MSADDGHPLQVTIQDLPSLKVVCFSCNLRLAPGHFSDQTQSGFQRIKAWASQHGIDLARYRIIGIPHVCNEQLTGYDCCVELPEDVTADDNSFQTNHVPGGRYAVLSIKKDSTAIGEAIGRFFTEYAPAHCLVIDPSRSSYEFYDEIIMEYRVPIQ